MAQLCDNRVHLLQRPNHQRGCLEQAIGPFDEDLVTIPCHSEMKKLKVIGGTFHDDQDLPKESCSAQVRMEKIQTKEDVARQHSRIQYNTTSFISNIEHNCIITTIFTQHWDGWKGGGQKNNLIMVHPQWVDGSITCRRT